jgi:predicted nucleic acid-binding protein
VARRLILDTGVIIAIKRGKIAADEVYRADDDVAVAAVTIAELVYGAALSVDSDRRREWMQHATALAHKLRVLRYDVDTAIRHGELLAATRAAGTTRGALDLVIAAHAAESGRTILTRDGSARFHELPGVRAVALA